MEANIKTTLEKINKFFQNASKSDIKKLIEQVESMNIEDVYVTNVYADFGLVPDTSIKIELIPIILPTADTSLFTINEKGVVQRKSETNKQTHEQQMHVDIYLIGSHINATTCGNLVRWNKNQFVAASTNRTYAVDCIPDNILTAYCNNISCKVIGDYDPTLKKFVRIYIKDNQVKQMYSQEEVIKLCEKAYNAGIVSQSDFKTNWIKNNIK